MPDPVLQRLGLHTDPFVPDLVDGQNIDPMLFDRALDPRVQPLLLKYYYDVYHWSDSGLVGNLVPGRGLGNFPAPDAVDDSLLILVAGTEDTGRASLLNLIRHEIRRTSPAMYEVESENDSRDQVDQVVTIAENFITEWSETKKGHAKKDLLDHFKLLTARPSAGTKTHYPGLFRQLRKSADACGISPVVVLVRKADDHDVWSVIYYSLAPLAKYVIVETTKSDQARACYDQITKDSGNVALIDARRLDVDTARCYLAARLQSERINPAANALWPFSDKALAAIYKPGSQPQAGGVKWPIGSLRGMLRATFRDHLQSLRNAGKPADQLSDDECQITEDLALKSSTAWQGARKKR